MKLYQDVLVAYDIEDNKARSRVFEKLKDIGLKPVQKSVFWGCVLATEKKSIHRLLNGELEPTDRAFLIPMSQKQAQAAFIFGYATSPFKSPNRFDVL
ncbi:CRISPR-associated protein Cas2 [gamma proteobacterium HTCC5015]|nr:CRISPR-associated protein Cas2 [gamma proteobacterium HTCC5015]